VHQCSFRLRLVRPLTQTIPALRSFFVNTPRRENGFVASRKRLFTQQTIIVVITISLVTATTVIIVVTIHIVVVTAEIVTTTILIS